MGAPLIACVAAAALPGCASGEQQAAEAAALAQSHFGTGDLAAARVAINRAIAERDDVVEYHLLRGRIEFAAGDRPGAFDAYYNALALDPMNTEALQAVSQIGVTTGNVDEAEDATDRILAVSPNDSDALLVKGLIALARRRMDEAIRYADRALAARPDNENARILKARSLYLKGDAQAALATIGGGADGAVSEGVALTRLEIFRQLGDAANMQREFVRLRNMRPNDTGLRIDEANFRFKRAERAAAQELLLGVLTHPREVYAELGVTPAEVARQAVDLWQQHGDADVAPAIWSRIATGAPPDARRVVARHLLGAGQLDQAETLIATLEGTDRQALAARLQAARGDARGAVASAATILARDETHCDALIATSDGERALGRADVAVQTGQRAAAECPDQIEAFITAAKAYDAFERPAGADRVFADGLKANPQNITLAIAYADWLLGEGKRRQAVAALRRYVRDTPSSVRGWTVYGDLCRRTSAGCAVEAAAGRQRAQRSLGIDLPPGQLQPNGLFGRLIER